MERGRTVRLVPENVLDTLADKVRIADGALERSRDFRLSADVSGGLSPAFLAEAGASLALQELTDAAKEVLSQVQANTTVDALTAAIRELALPATGPSDLLETAFNIIRDTGDTETGRILIGRAAMRLFGLKSEMPPDYFVGRQNASYAIIGLDDLSARLGWTTTPEEARKVVEEFRDRLSEAVRRV